jgi:hypothetical protein
LIKAHLVKESLEIHNNSLTPALDGLCFLANKLNQEINRTGELLLIHHSEGHVLVVAINDHLNTVRRSNALTLDEDIVSEYRKVIVSCVVFQNDDKLMRSKLSKTDNQFDKAFKDYNEHAKHLLINQGKPNYFV